ncbi:MAG: hypothetical protein JNM84_23065 [Planctomycetes bacterium]|nr:hypothetical protein [Planctomycetota bacterium]
MPALHPRFLAVSAALALSVAPLAADTPQRGPRHLDRFLPGAFLYVGIEDLKSFGEGCDKLAIGRLMDAATFERLVQEVVEATVGGNVRVNLDLFGQLESEELEGLIPEPQELAAILEGLGGSMSLAIVDPRGFGSQDPSLAIGVDFGAMGERAEAWIANALQHFADQGFIELKTARSAGAVTWMFQDGEDPEPISISLRDGYLFLSNDAALTQGFLAGGVEQPLAENASYRAARAELDPRDGLFLWCDLAPVRQLIAAEGATAKATLAALGLDRMHWVGLSMRPEGEAVLYKMRLSAEGGIAPLRRALGTRSKSAALELAALNTIGYVGLHLEPGGLLAAARELLQAVPSAERPDLDALLREAEKSLGMHLERDLLGELGGEIALIAAPTAANLPVPSFLVAVQLREESSADRLVAHAERLLGQKLTAQKYGRGRLFRLPEQLFPPEANFESFAVLGRWLLFAAPVPSARPTPALRRLLGDASGASLAQQPSFARAVGQTSLGQHGGTLLYYLDWPTLAERVYPTLRAAVPTLLERESLAELLPTEEALKAALVPAAGLLRLDDRGVWFESCSVF